MHWNPTYSTVELLRVLSLYLAPFAVASLGSRRAGWPGRSLLIAAFLGVAAGELWLDPLASHLLAAIAWRAAYYTVCVCALAALASSRSVHISGPGLLGLCLGAFVVIPALVEPRYVTPLFTVVAWECALSAYSACVVAGAAELPRRDALFFVLVNPVLVYPNRGEPLVASPMRIGVGRLLGGGLALVGGALAIAWLDTVAAPAHPAWGWLIWAGVFLAHYAAHAGRGALGVGCMRLLGYRIPERYHYPLAARSPSDFWRRWNIYVGDWARRYVFLPLARGPAGAAQSSATRLLRRAYAVLAAMACIGLLHDLGEFSVSFEASQRATLAFVAFGVIAILWHTTEAAVGWLRRQLLPGLTPGWRRWTSNGVFLAVSLWASSGFW